MMYTMSSIRVFVYELDLCTSSMRVYVYDLACTCERAWCLAGNN